MRQTTQRLEPYNIINRDRSLIAPAFVCDWSLDVSPLEAAGLVFRSIQVLKCVMMFLKNLKYRIAAANRLYRIFL